MSTKKLINVRDSKNPHLIYGTLPYPDNAGDEARELSYSDAAELSETLPGENEKTTAAPLVYHLMIASLTFCEGAVHERAVKFDGGGGRVAENIEKLRKIPGFQAGNASNDFRRSHG